MSELIDSDDVSRDRRVRAFAWVALGAELLLVVSWVVAGFWLPLSGGCQVEQQDDPATDDEEGDPGPVRMPPLALHGHQPRSDSEDPGDGEVPVRL
jgi:hypothetical protein